MPSLKILNIFPPLGTHEILELAFILKISQVIFLVVIFLSAVNKTEHQDAGKIYILPSLDSVAGQSEQNLCTLHKIEKKKVLKLSPISHDKCNQQQSHFSNEKSAFNAHMHE